MMTKISYEKIKKFIQEHDECELITTEKEFYDVVSSGTPPSEVKLLLRCKCGETFERGWGKLKIPRLKCNRCATEQRASKRRLSMEEINKRLSNVGLKYSRGTIENHGTRFYVFCPECGNEFDTCLYSVSQHQKDGYMTCQECSIKRAKNIVKTPYNKIKEYFQTNGCILLSAESEYENTNSKLTYIATCGHENITSWGAFQNSKHHVCSECKKKICAGEKAYNWKGGTQEPENVAFRKTYDLKKWHKDVFHRDNYTCQCCHTRGGRLNAHHLDGYNWCVEKRTNVDNGVCLCEDCHMLFHKIYGYGNNTKEQFEEFIKNANIDKHINNDEDIIIIDAKKRKAWNCRKVICIETNEVYNTIKEASEWCHGNVKAYLRGESKYAGRHPVTGEKLHWMYYDM